MYHASVGHPLETLSRSQLYESNFELKPRSNHNSFSRAVIPSSASLLSSSTDKQISLPITKHNLIFPHRTKINR